MKIRRNQLCPCGSHIKYKRCCGDNVKKAEQNQITVQQPYKPDKIANDEVIDHKTTRPPRGRILHIAQVAAYAMAITSLGGRSIR